MGRKSTTVWNAVRALMGALAIALAVTPLAESAPVASLAPAHAVDAAIAPVSIASGALPSVASRCLVPRESRAAGLATRCPASLKGQSALPPAPNSLALVLSGLLAVGAYHGTRSLARLGASSLPDWYHTGGPAQIGHVKAFDFNASFDEPVFGAPELATRSLERISLEWRIPPAPLFIPTCSPRSPPAAV